MYKIKIGNAYILDASQEIYVNDPKLELEANTSGSLTFTIYPENSGFEELKESITDESKEIVVYKDSEEIWSGRVRDIEEDFDTGWTVECEGELAFLDDSIQLQAKYQDTSIQDYLKTLLNFHNAQVGENKRFELGLCTVVDSNDSIYRYTNFESTLSVIKTDLLETFGGYLRIRKENGVRYLDYLNKSPRTSNQVIQLNENLLDNYKESAYRDYFTVIYPVGATIEDTQNVEGLDARVTIEEVNDGKPYLTASQEMLDKVGWIAKVVEWSDVHVSSILKSKAQAYLDDQQFPPAQMTVKAVDLYDCGLADDDFRMLDTVSCITTIDGQAYEYPVTAMTVYLMDPEQNTLTLGGNAKTYTGTKTSETKKFENSLDTLKTEVASNSYQKAQDYVNTLLNLDGKNGHIIWDEENGEILIMDTTDKETAVKIWRFNIYGWAYSGTGYNGPFKVATTEDGLILGQYIAAGTITTEQISAESRKEFETTLSDSILKSVADDYLKDYYTAVQVDSLFSVDNDSLKSVITATANTYVDDSLLNYYLKSEIDQTVTDLNTQIGAIQTTDNQKISELRTYLTMNINGITADVSALYADTDWDIDTASDFYLLAAPTNPLAGSAAGQSASATTTSGTPYLYVQGKVILKNGQDKSLSTWKNVSDAPIGSYKVQSVYTMYTVTDSATDEPDSDAEWQTTRPATDLTKYLWVKIRVVLADNFNYDYGLTCAGKATLSRLAECEAQLKVQSDQISAKVSQKDFDSLGKTVSENTSKIEQTASSLSSYVKTETYNDLAGRMTTAESSISQNAKSIDLKVASADFGTLIEQNSSSVRISWNKLSKYIQFEDANLNIYGSDSKLISSLSSSGNYFYYSGNVTGSIGSGYYVDTAHRILSLNVNSGATGLVIGAYDSSQDQLMTKFLYSNVTDTSVISGFESDTADVVNGLTKDAFYLYSTLHVGADVHMHNKYIINPHFRIVNEGATTTAEKKITIGYPMTVSQGASVYLPLDVNFNTYQRVKVVRGLVCVGSE
jgi:hypothetical protein